MYFNNMYFVKKPVRELTNSEYRQCYSNNLRDGGTMRGYLVDCRKYYNRSGDFVIMAYNGDDFLGWLLCFGEFGRQVSHFFVKKKYRRQGVGTALMQELKKTHKSPYVYPWNKNNGQFFSNFKIRCDSYDRKSFVDKKPRLC